MLAGIGKRPSGGDDESLIDLLVACHRRIRHHIRVASRIAAATPDAPQIADAAASVDRYFSLALPLHVADEDVSIAPRLPHLETVLARLTAEHEAHRPDVAELCTIASALALDPSRLATLARPLALVAARLTAAFESHLVLEESTVFPAIAALSPADQAAILTELRARRT